MRATSIWLVSIKKDKSDLLPRVKQNQQICMSTNYLAAATLYAKISIEASKNAIEQTNKLSAERASLMSFSGFADEDKKKSKKCCSSKNTSTTSSKMCKCKCCKFNSPKF